MGYSPDQALSLYEIPIYRGGITCPDKSGCTFGMKNKININGFGGGFIFTNLNLPTDLWPLSSALFHPEWDEIMGLPMTVERE